jgi:hypothetical protein
MGEVRENETVNNAGAQEAEPVAKIDAEKAEYVQCGLIIEYVELLMVHRH